MKPAAPTARPAMPSSGEREERLLPCPFCGSTTAPRLDFDTMGHETVWYVVCGTGGCGARSQIFGEYESQYREKATASWNRRASGWLPISEASRETCAEILGVQFLGGRMMREPFISFWSPTLNKFYCDPTHFQLLPLPPEEK